jgi:hypothetical protein
VISSSQGFYLDANTEKRARERTNTHKHQTAMPCVGFEPTIPASERARTVHALDRSATVTGNFFFLLFYYLMGTSEFWLYMNSYVAHLSESVWFAREVERGEFLRLAVAEST